MFLGNDGVILDTIDTALRFETHEECKVALFRASWMLIPFAENVSENDINNARCVTRPEGWN